MDNFYSRCWNANDYFSSKCGDEFVDVLNFISRKQHYTNGKLKSHS
jgi:hypothetical protein